MHYREVPNAPITSPPSDVDNLADPNIWTCDLCGAQHVRKYGTPPTQCLSCGQIPAQPPRDWGEQQEERDAGS